MGNVSLKVLEKSLNFFVQKRVQTLILLYFVFPFVLFYPFFFVRNIPSLPCFLFANSMFMTVPKPLSHYKNTKVLLLILTCSCPYFTVLLICFMLHDVV